MATRQTFFYKPETVEGIIGGRRVIPASRETLAEVIDNLRPGEAVVADFRIIPETDPISGIPYWKDEDSHLQSARFLKRGPQVEVMRYSTLDDAMERAVKPYKDRSRAISASDLSIPISGYGWWGHRDRRHRKVHLDDCIQGARLFAFSMANSDISRRITAREYNSDEKRDELKRMGGDYLIEVPSTSDDFAYDIMLTSVPLAAGPAKYARVLDLGAEQSSRAVTKRVTKRYGGRELYFGKHAIAAYIEVARMERENGNNAPLDMCPFALPSQAAVEFYNRMVNRAMVQEAWTTEEGKQRTGKRPLNKAEREILLWQYVSLHGPDDALFARGRLQDYNWQRMHPNKAA